MNIDKNVVWKVILGVIVVVASLIILKDEIIWQFNSYVDDSSEYSECNVAGLKLHGDLITYIDKIDLDENGESMIDSTSSESLVQAINNADASEDIKALIIEIDSYGGYPVASEEVTEALKRIKKPTVALIRESGLSAGYMVATGADIIFALKTTDVGSIGVTMSYLEYSEQNEYNGIKYVSLSSGKFKDTGDSDKPLNEEEKKLLMRDVNILHGYFVEAVAENRGLEIEIVQELADGSTMLGEMALENGLIDEIGGIYEVKRYLRRVLGEEVVVCE